MRNPFNRTPKASIEPFHDEATVLRFLGELGAKVLAGEITEKQASLGLTSVTKYFAARELFKTLQEPEKPKQELEVASKSDVEAVRAEVVAFRQKFDSIIEQQKRLSGIWG